MSKKVITFVLIFVALVSIFTYISINFNSKEKAVSFAIHKDLPELKKWITNWLRSRIVHTFFVLLIYRIVYIYLKHHRF